MSEEIRIEEVDGVPSPPKARVEDAEAPAAKLERKKDYLEGFLSQKPAAAPEAPAEPAAPNLSPQAQLGQLAFHDVSLSASGRQSCATCHDAASGHMAPNDLAVQMGGVDMDRPGSRSAQPIRYLHTNGAFGFDAEGKARGDRKSVV